MALERAAADQRGVSRAPVATPKSSAAVPGPPSGTPTLDEPSEEDADVLILALLYGFFHSLFRHR